jgi:hypothetical protein
MLWADFWGERRSRSVSILATPLQKHKHGTTAHCPAYIHSAGSEPGRGHADEETEPMLDSGDTLERVFWRRVCANLGAS